MSNYLDEAIAVKDTLAEKMTQVGKGNIAFIVATVVTAIATWLFKGIIWVLIIIAAIILIILLVKKIKGGGSSGGDNGEDSSS